MRLLLTQTEAPRILQPKKDRIANGSFDFPFHLKRNKGFLKACSNQDRKFLSFFGPEGMVHDSNAKTLSAFCELSRV